MTGLGDARVAPGICVENTANPIDARQPAEMSRRPSRVSEVACGYLIFKGAKMGYLVRTLATVAVEVPLTLEIGETPGQKSDWSGV